MRPSRPRWPSSSARAFEPPGRKSPPAARRLQRRLRTDASPAVEFQGSGSAGLNRLADGRQRRPGSMKERGIAWLRAAPCVNRRTTPPAREFRRAARRIARRRGELRRHRRQGHGRRDRERLRRRRCRPEVRRPRRRSRNSPHRRQRAGDQGRRHGRGLRRAHGGQGTARPSCRARRRAARRPGPTSRRRSTTSERVTGAIFGRVKGGFTVDLGGAVAFLPGSQVDIRPVRDVGPLMGTPQPFQILKMDRAPRQHRRVAPRRAGREPRRAAHRAGRQPEGRPDPRRRGQEHHRLRRVRRSRRRRRPAARHRHRLAAHQPPVRGAAPSASSVKVQVIRFNPRDPAHLARHEAARGRSVGGRRAKYPVGAKFTGRVTNITDYGAFVELEPGVEGLVHVSEMCWTKKNVHPGKIVSTCQEVEVMVLDVDPPKRRISLGLKQCHGATRGRAFVERASGRHRARGRGPQHHRVRPVRRPARRHRRHGPPVRPRLGRGRAKRRSATTRRATMVKAKVLDVDVEKERISLGIKQLDDDPFETALASRARRATSSPCIVTGDHTTAASR